jgi:hypothetical protein
MKGDAIAHETDTVKEADAGGPPQHRTSNSCGRKADVSEAQGKHRENAQKRTQSVHEKRTTVTAWSRSPERLSMDGCMPANTEHSRF